MANNLEQHETNVADAIRTKKGTTAKINPQNFASEILNIPTGGIDWEATSNILDNMDTVKLINNPRYDTLIAWYKVKPNDNGSLYFTDYNGTTKYISLQKTQEWLFLIIFANYEDGTNIFLETASGRYEKYNTSNYLAIGMQWFGDSSLDCELLGDIYNFDR